MFDSAPSNLPVEPSGTPQPTPAPAPTPAASEPPALVPVVPPTPTPAPAMPAVPPSAPSQPLSTAPIKKEPEDIFSGLDTATAAPVETTELDLGQEHPSSSKGKLVLVSVLIVLLVGAAGFGVWYFAIRERPVESPGIVATTSTNPPVVTSDAEPVVETPPALPEPDVVPNLPPPTSVGTTTEPTPLAPTTPPPSEAPDSDGDGLSDPEEAAIGTEHTMSDTDGDGFTDGAEMQNGYDPTAAQLSIAGSSRFRLAPIGSLLNVYIPAAWTVGADTSAPGDYAIQTGTPTTFGVHISELTAATSFFDWLSLNEPTRDPATLRSFTTKSGYSAYMSFDRLHSYIQVPGAIVTITYRASTAAQYDYRALYDYVVQNLRAL
jgi:hypothetical protein